LESIAETQPNSNRLYERSNEAMQPTHAYEVRPRKDHRGGVDLISEGNRPAAMRQPPGGAQSWPLL
jgi:hypothetical protein